MVEKSLVYWLTGTDAGELEEQNNIQGQHVNWENRKSRIHKVMEVMLEPLKECGLSIFQVEQK